MEEDPCGTSQLLIRANWDSINLAHFKPMQLAILAKHASYACRSLIAGSIEYGDCQYKLQVCEGVRPQNKVRR